MVWNFKQGKGVCDMNTDSPKFLLLKVAIIIVIGFFFGFLPIYEHLSSAKKNASVRVGQVYQYQTDNPFDRDNIPITIIAISNGYVNYRYGWANLYINNSMSLHSLETGYKLIGTTSIVAQVPDDHVYVFTNSSDGPNGTYYRKK